MFRTELGLFQENVLLPHFFSRDLEDNSDLWRKLVAGWNWPEQWSDSSLSSL